jgi:hypothetical protein
VREKQELAHQHQTNLTEQKAYYLEKVQDLEEQIATEKQTITQLTNQNQTQQENITNLTQQNQRSTETIRANAARITQLEEFLKESQADQQTKKTQINTLNRDKLDLQDRITGLIQSRKKDLEE